MDPVSTVMEILESEGGRQYGGERVTQLAHALQCATLAEREGAVPALVAAALLHDVGHLINEDARAAIRRGEDARHENRGRAFLGEWFSDAVTEPVRLHVAAKRYLTAREEGYIDTLSAGSVRSLAVQGGRSRRPRPTASSASLSRRKAFACADGTIWRKCRTRLRRRYPIFGVTSRPG